MKIFAAFSLKLVSSLGGFSSLDEKMLTYAATPM